MTLRALGLCCVAAAAGCHLALPLSGQQPEGTTDSRLPADATAADAAVDTLPPADAALPDVRTDAVAGDAGGTVTVLLEDDFDDAVLDGAKWYAYVEGSASVNETGGQLVITPPASDARCAANVCYAGIVSKKLYSLVNARVQVEVTQVLTAAAGDMGLYVQGAAGDFYYAMFFDNALLLYGFQPSSSSSWDVKSVAYDPQKHRYWRIAHRPKDNKVEFWTSDGTVWTLLRSMPNTVDLSQVELSLEGGVWDKDPAPGQAVYDNFLAVRLQ